MQEIKTETLVKLYFSGGLVERIRKYSKLKDKKFPDEYYNTLSGVSYNGSVANTNHISDITGQRATELADMREQRIEQYKVYKIAYRAIRATLADINEEQFQSLKLYADKSKKDYLCNPMLDKIDEKMLQIQQ